jgi:hypothetical protein
LSQRQHGDAVAINFKLKSLLLAGNILGSLASGQVAVDQVSMDMIFGAALGN